MSSVVLAAAMPRRQAFLGDARVIEQMRTEIRRLTNPSATVMLYHLPRGGQVYHVIPDVVDDAGDFFDQYQEEALYSSRCLFERRPLKSIHTGEGAFAVMCAGELSCSQRCDSCPTLCAQLGRGVQICGGHGIDTV